MDRIPLRRLQDRHGPLRAALLTTVFFWLFHVPSFYVETRSWAATAAVLGFLLLPHLGSRFIGGWLYNGAGATVLIAGLFHSMHNAIVMRNPGSTRESGVSVNDQDHTS